MNHWRRSSECREDLISPEVMERCGFSNAISNERTKTAFGVKSNKTIEKKDDVLPQIQINEIIKMNGT